MKKRSLKADRELAESIAIVRKVKRRHRKFLEYMEKMRPLIEKATTIKPEDGLRPFDI